jgi:hypothetical protein
MPNKASSADMACLHKNGLSRERSKDFFRRDMMKSKVLSSTAGKCFPVFQGYLKQAERAMWMNLPGESIERSKWLPAAKFMITSGEKCDITSLILPRSANVCACKSEARIG